LRLPVRGFATANIVDRRKVGQMVVQEATPGRGGDFGPPRHVSPNRGLADLDAEFEQLS
jgi:hypothetical protein